MQAPRIWSESIMDVWREEKDSNSTLYSLHALCRVLENIQGTLEQIDGRLARLEIHQKESK